MHLWVFFFNKLTIQDLATQVDALRNFDLGLACGYISLHDWYSHTTEATDSHSIGKIILLLVLCNFAFKLCLIIYHMTKHYWL